MSGKPIRKTLKEHPQAAPDAALAAASAAPKARLSPHVRREAAIRRALKLNDPLVTLARLACDADPVVRLQAAKALAPYLYPAQRAVEVSGAGGEALTVEVRKDSVGQFVQLGGGFQVPSIDTKNVSTQIAVNNGDTAVIGGIYEETIRNDVDKVPYLGDIPLFGYLFKQTGRSSDKTELLIFLTPRIVKETVNAIK